MRGWLISVACLVLTACAGSSSPPVSDIPPEEQYIEEYLIGIGDSLRVNVYRHQDLSATVAVRPDGKITVPVAGEIFVGSQTPVAVAGVIAKRLAEYVRDPIVTVTVAGMGSNEYINRIRVTGAVNSPRSQPFRSGMTVLDVILEAGGVTEFAAPSRTVIYRRSGEPVRVRLDKLLRSGDMSANYALQPGDILSVPERIF